MTGGLTETAGDFIVRHKKGWQMFKKSLQLTACLLAFFLLSCATPFSGGVVISRPDQHTHTYEAKEDIVLRATAYIIREKDLGRNVVVNSDNRMVESDFIESGGWRTKTIASAKQINWKECELTLSVITEKQQKTGWEMRRLVEKEQYDKIFSAIDTRVYEEMSKLR